MASDPTAREDWEAFQLSLARNDVLFRLQRRIGLIPAEGSGLVRRTVFWVGVTWLPLGAWAALNGRALAGEAAEPLLVHFTVHARLLLGIPALHVAEAVSQATLRAILPYFVMSGLVPPNSVPGFREALHGVARLRDRRLPWIVIATVALVGSYYFTKAPQTDELSWAIQPDGSLSFGAWWMAVGRTVFLVLVAGWLWRVGLLFRLFWRVSRSGLSLVPTHADGVAGLGFLERVPAMFAPVVFAASAVISAHWGHQVLYHGAHVADLRPLMAAFVVLVLVIFLLPNLAFVPLLTRTKGQARLEYGVLVGRYGRMTRERWVLGHDAETSGLLGAPELGPVSDVNALYDPVRRMRPAPIALGTLVPLLIPAVLPMLPVLAIEIPLKELLMGLAKALM
jgi:hypothetical protein